MPNLRTQTQLSVDLTEWQRQTALMDKAMLEGDVKGFFEAQARVHEIEARQRRSVKNGSAR